MTRDPARLNAGGPSELGDLVSSARADVLSDEAVARLHARLLAPPPPGSPPEGAPPDGPPPAAPPPAAAPAPAAPPPPPAAVALGSSLARVAAPAAVKATAGAWAAVGGAGVALTLAIGGALTSTAPRPAASATPVAASAPPSGSATAHGAVVSPPATSASAPDADASPALPALPAARPPARAVPRPSAPRGASEGGETDPREGTLLLEARRVLESDPARALALTEQHARAFPTSQLKAERARLAADARRLLGR